MDLRGVAGNPPLGACLVTVSREDTRESRAKNSAFPKPPGEEQIWRLKSAPLGVYWRNESKDRHRDETEADVSAITEATAAALQSA
jgi:hypothetical protein